MIKQHLPFSVVLATTLLLCACVTTSENVQTPVGQVDKAEQIKKVEKTDKAEIASAQADVNETSNSQDDAVKNQNSVSGAYEYIICRYSGNVTNLNHSTGDALFNLFGGGFKNFQMNFFEGQEDALKIIGYSQSVKTFHDARTPACQLFSQDSSELNLYLAVRNIANFYALQGGTSELNIELNTNVPTLILAGQAGTSGFGYKWGLRELPLSKEVYEDCTNNEFKNVVYTEKSRSKIRTALKGLNDEVAQKYPDQAQQRICKLAALTYPATQISDKQQGWGEKNAAKIFARRYEEK